MVAQEAEDKLSQLHEGNANLIDAVAELKVQVIDAFYWSCHLMPCYKWQHAASLIISLCFCGTPRAGSMQGTEARHGQERWVNLLLLKALCWWPMHTVMLISCGCATQVVRRTQYR